MMAAQLVEPRRFELCQVQRPDPAQGQVRVQLQGCGVCASSLPVWSGKPWFSYPLAPGQLGHEGWGIVEALGPGVPRAVLGQRVATVSDRSFAEFDVVDAADLVALPGPHPELAPLEPFGCLFNVRDRAGIEALARQPDAVVAVVGLGFIGLGVARLAALTRLASGAGPRVIALSSNAAARRTAAAFGAEVFDSADRVEAREAVYEWTDGRGCACVVECAGFQAPLDLAGDLVAEGGRLVIAGYHQDGARTIDLQQWNWKGIDVINAHERSRARIVRGMRMAAQALIDDPAWTDLLITHRFPLHGIDEAFAYANERPADFVKGAVLTGRVAP
jgi:threonine dehydrogenase-like Zn-dependent dehydrogenase